MKTGTIPLERPLAVYALCAGIGVLAGRFTEGAPVFLMGAGAAAGVLAALLAGRRAGLRTAGVCAAVLFLCMLRSFLYYHQPLPAPGEVQVTGSVREEPVLDAERGHAAVQLRDVLVTDGQGQEYRLSGAYWTWYTTQEAPLLPKAGNRVRFSARLYLPEGQTNPYGFDFREYLLQRGIPVGLFNQGAFEEAPGNPWDLWAFFARARSALSARLTALFGEDSALPRALLLGERQDLGEETLAAFSRAGVSHVLAVSGLHVGLLAGLFTLLLSKALSRRSRLWVTGVFLFSYCLLLDGRAPAVRASVITLAVLWGGAHKRRSDMLSALCLSFILVLILQPQDLSAVGFQLSFGAALGMLLLGTRWYKALSPLFGRRAGRALGAAFSAVTGTVIPIAGTFHSFSLIGLILSPLLCAALGVMLPVYLILLALSAVSLPLAQVPAGWAAFLTRLMLAGVDRAAAFSLAAVNVPAFPWPFLPSALLALWAFSPYTHLTGRRRLAVLGTMFALGAALHLMTLDRGLSYTQMDVGSADCALIQDGRTTVVVDTGEDGHDLCSYLLSTGRSADLLVLTHLHMDHLGGVGELLERNIPIREVWIPVKGEKQRVAPEALALLDSLRLRGIPVRETAAGVSWRRGNILLTVLWPEGESVRFGQDANDYCMALSAELGECSLLLCGDLTGTYEWAAARPARVLKVAHHGSASSTQDAFLDAVAPEIALISAGRNRGASGEVLARLNARGIPCYTTAQSGALRLDIRGDRLEVTPYLPRQE